MTNFTKHLTGNHLTRGDHGVRATTAHALVWDYDDDGGYWRPAGEYDDPEMISWGVWDPDHGWMVGNWEGA